ncbi:MAG: hypothetical protein ACOYL6_09510 [Bacteriovoracaceae bacterium]
MLKPLIGLFVFCLFISAHAVEETESTFGGRVSALNNIGALLRVKVTFKNMKFLNKRDKVEFWSETTPSNRCTSYVVAKSSDYVLLKVPNYDLCVEKVHLTTGSYLYFESIDLEKNLKIAQELVDIILKKQLALSARLLSNKRDLDTYPDKVEGVNKRYQVLREKLELEWRKEISDLETDKNQTLKVFQDTQARLDDVNHKLEQYRVYDSNLELDRWALDKKLYYKK